MKLFANPDRFEAIASGVNKWALTIALVVGGLWTLFVYRDVPRRQELKSQSNLVISVSAEQLHVSGDQRLYISGTIEVRNVGTRNTRLIMEPRGQIEVARAVLRDGERLRYEMPDTISIFMWPERPPESKTSLMGGVDYLPFVHEVDRPGIYLVSFSALRDEVDVDRAGGHGGGGRPLSWIGATHVVVGDSLRGESMR